VSTVAVVLIVLLVLVALLAAGGYAAMSRRTRGRDHELLEQLGRAERELAAAHAADKGWDPATLDAAARAAAAERFGSQVEALQLVQVIDKPGTDADQAVFRVQTADGEHALTLGRSGGVWGAP
jgi:type II secretory pathway pseudopilin PulG